MQDFDDQDAMHLDTAVHPEKIHPTAFIAQGAVVVGDVTLGEDVGVWFNSTLRGRRRGHRGRGRAPTSRRAASCTPTPATPA